MRIRSLIIAGAAIAGSIVASAVPATAAPPGPASAVIGGGTRIITTHGVPLSVARSSYLCTLTTIGYDARGDLVGLTNAHCFYDNVGNQYHGDAVYLEKPGTYGHIDVDRGAIGRVAVIGPGNPVVPGPQGAGLDYAVIVFDRADVTPTARIGDVTVTGFGPPPSPGSPVCRHTDPSGTSCGQILAHNGPYFIAALPDAPGESGSPVLTGTTIVGALWVTAAGTSITEILTDLDRSGGPGAGFRLP
ncbi:hypothetical protein ACFWUP_19660 [Nocardia sp. NPDC058658]|uniref:hypothetical protein n=1 Tax=Nocardia sp. NPDC058658 TaxID=3346580 RepID=UPI0036599EB3